MGFNSAFKGLSEEFSAFNLFKFIQRESLDLEESHVRCVGLYFNF
jgi:hypothetical protein